MTMRLENLTHAEVIAARNIIRDIWSDLGGDVCEAAGNDDPDVTDIAECCLDAGQPEQRAEQEGMERLVCFFRFASYEDRNELAMSAFGGGR